MLEEVELDRSLSGGVHIAKKFGISGMMQCNMNRNSQRIDRRPINERQMKGECQSVSEIDGRKAENAAHRILSSSTSAPIVSCSSHALPHPDPEPPPLGDSDSARPPTSTLCRRCSAIDGFSPLYELLINRGHRV
jgi:hypothetical protein